MKTPSLVVNFSNKKMAGLIIGLILFTANAHAAIANSEKTIKSKIESVTVFTNAAQIYRSATVNVNAGITTLLFENLEPAIDAASIQASGTGSFVIMDVQQVIKYPEPKQNGDVQSPKNTRQIKLLQDSLVMIDYDLEELNTKQDALTIEKNSLLNNRIIKGETKKDTLNLLKEAMTFLREKLTNINSESIKLKKELYRMNIKKRRMQSDLALLQNYNVNTNEIVKDETKYQIVVTVSSEAPANGSVNINYMLQGAGWTSSYDIRAKGAGGNVQLVYKAQVFQNTGMDWNDVKLKLSTANPNQSNVKPVLSTWWVSFYNPYRYPAPSARGARAGAEAPSSAVAMDDKIVSKEMSEQETPQQAPAPVVADYTTASENFTNMEYEIKLPYTIPSDGKTHFVAIQTKDVPANYVHFAAPKIDKDAFLVAQITNWDELNLVPGSANIYFDGTFVGQSYINPNSLTDTLDITLGRDKNIVVTRVKQKDKTKEKIIGDQKVKTITYEISIRNTKSAASDFNLQDQIPVSQNKEVVVQLVESSNAELDPATGILNWKFNLKSKDTKKIIITYSVKYPKDKLLAGM